MSYNPVPSLNNGNATFNNNVNVSGISTLNAGVKTTINSEADGATITFDMDESNTHSVQLGGNRTLAVNNVDAGQKFTLRIQQDSTGNREAVWWDDINWIISGSGQPTLNSGVNEVDYFGFLCTSGGYYDGFHMTELGTGGGGGGGGGGGTTYNVASGLPYASGEFYLQEINQNAADIVTVSGLIGTGGGGTGSGLPYASGDYYLQEIRTNSASGVSISGTLQPQITQNSSDIVVVSGLIGTGGGGLPYASGDYYLNSINTVSGLIPTNTFNITGGDGSNYTIDGMGLSSASDPNLYLHKGHTYVFNKTFSGHPFAVSATDGGSVYADADGNNIEIGSSAGSVAFEVPQDAPSTLYYYCTAHPSAMKGLIYTTSDGSLSGYFESRVDSADSSVTANSGYFESRVDQNAADIVTVSGLTGGGSYTAGSGLTLAGTEFNVYGGSGNFEYVELQTDNTTVPKLKFTGSGVTDTPITLEVRSSYESVNGSGSALLFQGTQGQLFSITDNLSSGVIFSVADVAGLPMLEVDASGHVHIGEYADDITSYKPILISGGVPTSTTNKLYNDAGTLYFNGSALGAGLPYISGDYYLQEIRSNSASGVAISGYFESRVDTNAADIITVSGLTGGGGGGGGAVSAVANGVDNRVVTFSSTDALNGEANLTFNGSTLAVNGAFTATTKSFLIDHPTKEDMKLQYASLEGPENGVYIRGTSGSNLITLPEYWSTLVDQSTVTVTLTSIGYYQPLYIKEKGKNYIKVGGCKGSYDYVVYGERKDVEKLKVEW